MVLVDEAHHLNADENVGPTLGYRLVEKLNAAGQKIYGAIHSPGNDPSVAVTQRLGMTALGRTKRWYGAELDAFWILRPEGRADDVPPLAYG